MSHTIKAASSGTVRISPAQTAETLVADPASLAPTLAGQGLATGTTAAPTGTTLVRTTVLPKPGAGGAPVGHVDRLRYETRGLLGEGGMGEVIRSIDNDIERTVAIKRLKPEARDPGHIARFVDEIRTVGSMEHPNIVPIHDVGIDEQGQYFFVMKYVAGETLESIIAKLRAGDPKAHAEYGHERRVEIFFGILEAIAYAHARGVLHRDLKPANVMVGTYGEVTVMDWGIALQKTRAAEAAAGAGGEPSAGASPFRTQEGTLIGTPAYMSPEQARAERVDERSDVYSLSVLFHELLTLEHYLGDATTIDAMLAGVREKTPRFASFVSSPHQPGAPAELAHYISKGVAKDPAARYQSIAEMIERLRRRAEGDFPIQCPLTLTKRTTMIGMQFVDKHPIVTIVLVWIVGLAVLGGLGLGAWRIFS